MGFGDGADMDVSAVVYAYTAQLLRFVGLRYSITMQEKYV
jgi:hypothetical protein